MEIMTKLSGGRGAARYFRRRRFLSGAAVSRNSGTAKGKPLRFPKYLSEPEFRLPPTNDVHYIKKEDSQIQRVLMAIATGTTLSDAEDESHGDPLSYSIDGSMGAFVNDFSDVPANVMSLSAMRKPVLRII